MQFSVHCALHNILIVYLTLILTYSRISPRISLHFVKKSSFLCRHVSLCIALLALDRKEYVLNRSDHVHLSDENFSIGFARDVL